MNHSESQPSTIKSGGRPIAIWEWVSLKYLPETARIIEATHIAKARYKAIPVYEL